LEEGMSLTASEKGSRKSRQQQAGKKTVGKGGQRGRRSEKGGMMLPASKNRTPIYGKVPKKKNAAHNRYHVEKEKRQGDSKQQKKKKGVRAAGSPRRDQKGYFPPKKRETHWGWKSLKWEEKFWF